MPLVFVLVFHPRTHMSVATVVHQFFSSLSSLSTRTLPPVLTPSSPVPHVALPVVIPSESDSCVGVEQQLARKKWSARTFARRECLRTFRSPSK